MLIITSDLHLTDQTLAPSVPAVAFDKLHAELEKLVKLNGHAELVLLGDAFDILRSSEWLVEICSKTFVPRAVDVRPWSGIDGPLRRVVSRVLGKIQEQHGPGFQRLRDISGLKITWVPGNHDRLVYYTPEGREFLRNLGIQVASHKLIQEQYGVLLRHGHGFDKWNIRGTNYKLAPLGDAIVVEIISRLQVEVAMERQISRFDHEDIAFLGALEYVRPHLHIPAWLRAVAEGIEDELLTNAVKTAWARVLSSFKKSQMLSLLKGNVEGEIIRLFLQTANLDGALINLLAPVEGYFTGTDKAREDALSDLAVTKENVDCIVCGHTHALAQGKDKKGRRYFNTGWWERSWSSALPDSDPMMVRVPLLIIHPKKGEPEMRFIDINEPIHWKAASFETLTTDGLLRRMTEMKTEEGKNAVLEQAAMQVFAKTSGVAISRLTHAGKTGFDMLVRNSLSPRAAGNTVAVQVKHTIVSGDLARLQKATKKASAQHAWLVTSDKVSQRTKAAAFAKNVTILDADTICRVARGRGLKSALLNL
ncbi:MAG: restriction endonuclease [Elusimicrobia bacterium]|nr:restriction endonuclease [Elusimicrobiota bacterium]